MCRYARDPFSGKFQYKIGPSGTFTIFFESKADIRFLTAENFSIVYFFNDLRRQNSLSASSKSDLGRFLPAGVKCLL
jgi:hypothetical protein